MDTWNSITSRRDVRAFDDRTLSADELERILEAGRRSPSSQNWQPWTFVVAQERDLLQRLSEVWRGASHVAQSAATVALVADEQADERQRNRLHYDLGQATMQMMLAAADQGIASGHSVVENQDLARRLLHLPESQTCYYLIPFGWPEAPLRPVDTPDRRPYDDVVRLASSAS